LAVFLRGAFNHRWLRRLGGGRLVVQDLLMPAPEALAMIGARNIAALRELGRTDQGCVRSLDHALARAVIGGHISLRQAVGHAADSGHLIGLVRTARRLHRA
jgi:hypothetical protein